jgi:hypothetical protein
MKYTLSALLIFSLFLIAFPQKLLSANEDQLITELKVFDNDTTYRYDYVYDNFGNKVLETKLYQSGNFWIRMSQTEWQFENSHCLHQIESVWNNNVLNVVYTIDYNWVNGLLTNETHNTYTGNSAQPVKKVDYQYNSTVLRSKKQFDMQANAWVLSQQSDYANSPDKVTDTVTTSVYQASNIVKQYLLVSTYKTNGLVDSQLLQEKDSNNNWVNFRMINWYYKPTSTVVASERTKNWDSANLLWENSQRTDYEYNANNQLISETYQYWKVMFWEDDTRYNYQYDASSRMVKKTLVQPIYHMWRDMISVNYSDFTNNKAGLMESKYEFWGGNTGELTTSFIAFDFNNEKTIQKGKTVQIEYLPADSTQSVPNTLANHAIPVYPNPSSGIYYINTQNYNIQSWIITDMSGRILKKETQLFSSGVIDITDLPQGIYLLKVMTTDALFTQKLIKK